MKTVSFLKQQKENLEKVNDVIKQLNAVTKKVKNRIQKNIGDRSPEEKKHKQQEESEDDKPYVQE